jgi:hypothetical protein
VGVALRAWPDGPSAEVIKRTLPVYPGARLTADSGGSLGYDLPRGTSHADVRRFYDRRMTGWVRPKGCPGYERDGALALIGPDVFDPSYLKIFVKSDGAGHCDEWSWVIYS